MGNTEQLLTDILGAIVGRHRDRSSVNGHFCRKEGALSLPRADTVA
jgi:hypothetical protein